MPNTDGLKRGGSKGRPKGTPNRTTVEVRELAQKLVTDPTCRVRRDLPSAIRAVDRAVEQLADYFHYAPDWETEHARIWVDDLPDGFEEPFYRRPLRGAFIKPPPQGAVADCERDCQDEQQE